MVEATFIDATGKEWTLLDKTAIFTTRPLGPASDYPLPGVVRCEVLSRRTVDGRNVVHVLAIDGPTTDGDVQEFDVDVALLSPAS